MNLVPIVTEAGKQKMLSLGADLALSKTAMVMGSLIEYISTSILQGRDELRKSFLDAKPLAEFSDIFLTNPLATSEDARAAFLNIHPLLKIG